jgi:filamentous hemagglutinin
VSDVGGIKNVYNSIKDAPKYPDGFTDVKNGTRKVPMNDPQLLANLKQIEPGEWRKVYRDGYDARGNEISVHYHESPSGKVFDVKVKNGWSNKH